MTVARSVPAADYAVRLASGPADLAAAQALRYAVFVEEMGATGPGIDHEARTETDRFDAAATHLLLEDRARPAHDRLVGLYRLTHGTAPSAFASDAEFDLAPLLATGRPLMELGRSCLHRDHRGGTAMFHLWQGIAAHVAATGTQILFGVASFPGTDTTALAAPLSYLHRHHLAPPALRVTSRDPDQPDMLPDAALDRVAAMRATPALIKAYLRLGGGIGQGIFTDRAFNTTDVCLVMDTARLDPRRAAIYAPARGAP